MPNDSKIFTEKLNGSLNGKHKSLVNVWTTLDFSLTLSLTLKILVSMFHNHICLGLSKRDVTPEATKTVIERECSGISTAIVGR